MVAEEVFVGFVPMVANCDIADVLGMEEEFIKIISFAIQLKHMNTNNY